MSGWRSDDRRVLRPGEAIRYEPHALDRMAEFGVTGDDVRATLEAPDRMRPADHRPPTGPCTIYLRSLAGRGICKVYVREGSEPMRVATAAWHGEGPRTGGR